jgi:hypothetical protein
MGKLKNVALAGTGGPDRFVITPKLARTFETAGGSK